MNLVQATGTVLVVRGATMPITPYVTGTRNQSLLQVAVKAAPSSNSKEPEVPQSRRIEAVDVVATFNSRAKVVVDTNKVDQIEADIKEIVMADDRLSTNLVGLH